MFKRAYQGETNPKIGEIDNLAALISLKLSVMEGAADTAKAGYAQEIRALTQKHADRVVALVNAFLK